MRGAPELALLLALAACAGDETDACTTGDTRACSSCAVGTGVETCNDGTWGACQCGDSRDAGVTDDGDAGVVRDAGTRDAGPSGTCTPTQTQSDANCAIVDLVAGSTHTCVLRAYGEVNCFGADDDGQLGRGDTPAPTSGWSRDDLVPAGALRATSIAARADLTCAIDSDARAWCFGSNASGKLGTGTTAVDLASSRIPVRVAGVEGARQLALGIDHACAATGTDVLCWGSNEFEQLGRGGETGTLESSPTPAAVVGVGAVSAMASGDGFTCAIEGGKTRCLGRNDIGQLGDGTTEKAPEPVTVAFTNDPTAIAIAAGDDHACAVLDVGEVWCWGSNLFGQIDANARFISSSSPMQIDLSGAPLGDVVSIEAGARHTCARRSDSTVVCWGAAGSLCDPFGTGANVAPRMFGWFGVRARAIATGGRHSCALREDRRVQCLGDNQLGQSFPSMPSAFCEHDDPITILP